MSKILKKELDQQEFLEFLFSLIGSCSLGQLNEEELADFIHQLFSNYNVKKINH